MVGGAGGPSPPSKTNFDEKKNEKLSDIKKKNFFTLFFILKSPEAYAKKILPSPLSEGGGGGLQIIL